jgi:hypothetical protein
MNCRFLCLIYVFVAPLVSLSTSQATQASEPSGYYLSIDEGTAGSAELMRGDFGAAIAAAHAAARVDQGLSAHLTLCVAYIRTNALENAAAACDKAVRAADVPITTLGNPYGQRKRELSAFADDEFSDRRGPRDRRRSHSKSFRGPAAEADVRDSFVLLYLRSRNCWGPR